MYQILLEIQTALKSPKDKNNNFGGFKYRKAEDILAALKPMLKKHGCVIILDTELSFIGGRYYIKAIATLKKGDAEISAAAYAREEETKKGMDASQITGSATSYARKYALAGLFAVDDEDDADSPQREEVNNAPYTQRDKKPQQRNAPPAANYNNAPPKATTPMGKSPGEFVNIVFAKGYESALTDPIRVRHLFNALADYIKANDLDLDVPSEHDKEAIEFMFNYLVSLEPEKVSSEVKYYMSIPFDGSPFEKETPKEPVAKGDKKTPDFRKAPESPAEKPLITEEFLEMVQGAIVTMEEGMLDSRGQAEFIKKWLPLVSKTLGRTISMDKLKDGLYELVELAEKTFNNKEA